MKKAYNRLGFGALALFLSMQVIGAVIVAIVSAASIAVVLSQEVFLSAEGLEGIFEYLLELLNSDAFMNILYLGEIVGSVVGIGAGILIARKILPKERYQPERRNLSGREFIVIVLLAFGLWGIGATIGNLPAYFGADVELMKGIDDKTALIMTIYAVLGAPILEELAFRKLLMDSVHHWGQTVAAFTSALFFGLVHGNAAQFLLAFPLGLLFATVYMRTGNIWYTIFLHFMINLTGSIPDIFALMGMDVSLIWNLAVMTLTAVGMFMLIPAKKMDLFRLSRPVARSANRLSFKRPGMIVFTVLGLVTLLQTELALSWSTLMQGFSYSGSGWKFHFDFNPGVLTRLIPISLTVVTVILVIRLVGRHSQPLPFELTGETIPASSPDAAG